MVKTDLLNVIRTLEMAVMEIEWDYPIDYSAAIEEAVKVLERCEADGCAGCAFRDTEEWEMPCAKCKRNCKDYWRREPDKK